VAIYEARDEDQIIYFPRRENESLLARRRGGGRKMAMMDLDCEKRKNSTNGKGIPHVPLVVLRSESQKRQKRA